jgi:hypothetical protein
MVGQFIAALIAKGRAIRDLIATLDDDLGATDDPHGHAIQDDSSRCFNLIRALGIQRGP